MGSRGREGKKIKNDANKERIIKGRKPSLNHPRNYSAMSVTEDSVLAFPCKNCCRHMMNVREEEKYNTVL